MRRILIAICLLVSLNSLAGEWVVPWVANKTDEWSTKLAINNHHDTTVDVTLEAVRPDGQSFTIQGYGVPPQGQITLDMGSVFAELGSGSGFTVFIRSDQEALSASAKISSLKTASKDSPALGHAIPAKNGTDRLIFPSVPNTPGTVSALVLVNLEPEPVQVSLEGHGQSGPISPVFQMTLPSRRPVAVLADSIFPDEAGSYYVVAKADAAMVGSTFNFNSLREPSLINATDHPRFDAAKLTPLWQVMDTTQTATGLYVDNANSQKAIPKDTCPEVDLGLTTEAGLIQLQANFDWGSGCTSALGVYREGAINMDLAIQTALGQPSWATGTLDFDQYGSAFDGVVFELDGTLYAEGRADSELLTLEGQWTAQGSWPGYPDGSLTAQTMLNFRREDGTLIGYGSYHVLVDQLRHFDLTATVNRDTPLSYEVGCPWPTRGILGVRLVEGRQTWEGQLNFDTGNCQTAILTMQGLTEIIDLTP